MPTIHHLLTEAARTLAPTSTTPRLDAELLLAYVLGWTRARLLAYADEAPDAAQVARFRQLVARRAHLEPVAYLIGEREFYGLTLAVDRRVLVPRPETELLVELALTHALAPDPARPLRIADVGTGSGAIALALAHHLPTAHIFATDMSREALDVAAANLARHNLGARVTLAQGDLLAPMANGPPLDLIVSNPPYTVLAEIDEGVRRHEPRLALDGGPDGLEVYRRLAQQAPPLLHPGGALLLEIGATQAQAVVAMLQAAFPGAAVAVHRDLAGHPRVVVARTTGNQT
jgi:release factor glutamine methyltransferase